MNTASFLMMFILVWGYTLLTVSAFVVQIPSSRTLYNVPKAGPGLCRMASTTEPSIPDKRMEEVWRYAKKHLISVGGKGATEKHGNSLRQLLDDHTIVKVKVNTKTFGKFKLSYVTLICRCRCIIISTMSKLGHALYCIRNGTVHVFLSSSQHFIFELSRHNNIITETLEKAYEILRDFAIESGASESIEMIQMREKERTIMFALPGTLENIENGSFPPPPPPPYDPEAKKEDKDKEEAE